jgi:hypothetical protein
MQISALAESEDGYRLEMELSWGVMTISMGRYVGKIRFYKDGEWLRTSCCLCPNGAVKSFKEDVEKYKMKVLKYQEEGNYKEEEKRSMETISAFALNKGGTK